MAALTSQFELELDRSLARRNTGIAPYSRFVRSEQQAIVERQQELSAAREAFLGLKEEIESSKGRG